MPSFGQAAEGPAADGVSFFLVGDTHYYASKDAPKQLDEDSQIIYRPLESLLMPSPWYKGRVVLIGDTVHATTPHMASGACIGIEDALVLADELARAGSVDQALDRYLARRWERCRMVVQNSGRLGAIEIAGGDREEHARIMRDTLIALAAPI